VTHSGGKGVKGEGSGPAVKGRTMGVTGQKGKRKGRDLARKKNFGEKRGRGDRLLNNSRWERGGGMCRFGVFLTCTKDASGGEEAGKKERPRRGGGGGGEGGGTDDRK